MKNSLLRFDQNLWKFLPGLLSLSTFFIPHVLNPIIFRSAKAPLEIKSNHSAPPKSAFESLSIPVLNIDQEWKEIENKKSIDLNSSNTQGTNWNPVVQLQQKRVILPEMQITSDEVATFTKIQEQDHSWMNELNPRQRDRLEIAQENSNLLEQNWEIPTLREQLAQKVDEINLGLTLAKSSFSNSGAASNTGNGSENDVSNRSRNSAESNIHISTITKSGQTITPHDMNNSTGIMMLDPEIKFKKLKGSVLLASGLALGDRTLEIHRFVEGVSRESAQINIESGQFEINVEDMLGKIVAELYDKSGAVIASGFSKLSENGESSKIEIVISPKNQFAGNLVNFNRNPKKLIYDKINSLKGERAEILYASLGVMDQTDALGSFQFPKISDSSWGIVRAKANKFREAIFLLNSGVGKNLSLMPESLISALESLTNDTSSGENSNATTIAEKGGIVWGQVLFDGKPVSGISVSLELNDDIKPIYLDGFIPNSSAAETTENGYFIFTNLSPGYHSFVAQKNGEYFGHMNTVVDDGAISIGNIENTTKHQSVSVKIYDAFSGNAEEAELSLQSLKTSLYVPGIANVTLPVLQRLSLAEVKPALADYAPSRFNYSDSDEYLHMPLIRLSWLDYLSQQMRISQSPALGVVVGFVPEDDFEAYLSHENNYSNTNIVYFDHQGLVTNMGVTGGGFVMFNVPPGTQSIVVMSKKTEMLSTQVIPVDEKTISTIKF